MDNEIEGMDVAVGAVVSEGEQRSSTLSTAHDDRPVAPLAPGQRWSLARKREVVLRLMQGEPVEGLSRRLGLPSAQAGRVAPTRARRDRRRVARAA